jgi:aryl carrier-like protein
MFQKLPLEQWTDTLRSKVQGSLNLHQHLPANLDFLVLLSSICGIIGASGQSNYAFGCAYQDAMARYRLAVGQKAISIDLGIVEGVGYTAEHQGVASFMRSLGMQPISEEYLHALLEYYCDQGCRIQGSSEAQVIAGIMTEEEMHCTGIVRPRFYSRPLVRHLERLKLTVHAKTSQQKVVETVPTKFTPTTDSFGDQFQVKGSVSMAICRRLSDMLALSTIDIDPAKPLHAYGVDSLVAMEIRNWFKEEMGVDVAVFDILSNMSIDSLAGKIVDGKS